MGSKRILPAEMRKHAAVRTDSSLQALFDYLDQLGVEIHSGRYKGKALDLKAVCVGAGLNLKFLYGPKHRASAGSGPSTKATVEDRLKALNTEIARQGKAAVREEQPEAQRLQSEISHWQERYRRLAGYSNLWHARIREQQRAIRELKRQLGEVRGPGAVANSSSATES
jgi:hypothetical protein